MDALTDELDAARDAIKRIADARADEKRGIDDRDEAIRSMYRAGMPCPDISRTLIQEYAEAGMDPKGQGVSLSNVRQVVKMIPRNER